MNGGNKLNVLFQVYTVMQIIKQLIKVETQTKENFFQGLFDRN